MASPRRLSHVLLFVRDPAKMRAFYEDVLGFAVTSATPGEVRLSAGGTEIVLRADPPFGDLEYRDFINQLKGNMRGTGSAMNFVVDDVDALFAELASKGLTPIDPEKNLRLDAPLVRPDGRRAFAIEDPEGYWLWFAGPARA